MCLAQSFQPMMVGSMIGVWTHCEAAQAATHFMVAGEQKIRKKKLKSQYPFQAY
jgi:hypothetical protein